MILEMKMNLRSMDSSSACSALFQPISELIKSENNILSCKEDSGNLVLSRLIKAPKNEMMEKMNSLV